MSVTQIIRASYDSFVNQEQPNQNYGDSPHLRLLQNAGTHRQSFLYFPLTIPSDALVLSAVLKVTLADAWSGSNTITAKRVTQKWGEHNVTYSNAPTVTDTGLATQNVTGGVQGDDVLITLTDMVQAWVNFAARYGVRLTIGGSSLRLLYSSEAPDGRPELAVSWATPPDAPTNLRPNGGRAVALAKPVLLWDGAIPTETQVQIGTDPDLVTADFDSGYVANTLTQYDLAASAYAGVTNNTTRHWRVRIKDEHGVASAWSDIAEFEYRSHGTLTITVPAVDNDDVLTTTPTITHTFTGRTQQFAEYLLYENDTLIYTRPKQVDPELSFTLPPSLLRSSSATYQVYVRVWDTFDRETNGSTLGYVEQRRLFQVAFSGSVAPVTGLAVSSAGGHILLTWSRSPAPDYFVVRVDDEIILDRLNPGDLSTGGSNYALRYFRAVPRTSHTYEVLAVVLVSGAYRLSDSNPSVELEWTPRGIWLTDEDSEDEVQVLGQQEIGELIGEAGATFMPLGRRDPVRVVDQVRGFEGQVQGQLIDTIDQDIAEARASFERMKAPEAMTHRLRLAYAWRNIPVAIGEATLPASPLGEESYSISFDFWQTSEFGGEPL